MVCGYVYEGPEPPAECPICYVRSHMFILQKDEETNKK
jgi:rubrerythrin